MSSSECAKRRRPDIPLTVYYAYKQQDSARSMGQLSTGWHTLLSGLIECWLGDHCNLANAQ